MRKYTIIGIAALAALIVGVGAVLAIDRYDPTKTWNVTPVDRTFPDDRACPTGSFLLQDLFQSVTEEPEGTYSYSTVLDGMPVTIYVTTYADNSFDFEIDGGVTPQMFVKGGADSGFLLYQYQPPVSDATNTGPVSYDTGLHDGYKSGDVYQDVSHLDFCVIPKGEPLTAEKTAETSYTRTYTWDITKGEDGTYEGFIGDAAFNHGYTVSVDQTVDETLFKIYGTITVYNSNAFDVDTTVSDSVGGVGATLNCGDGDGDNTLTVPAEGNATCSYYAFLGAKTNGTNTATIDSQNAYVDGTTAEKAYTFGEPTTIDGYPTINVTDDKYGDLGSASGDFTFPVYYGEFQCSGNPADYTDGVWIMDEFVNTATIDQTGQSDDAKVNLTCYAPVLDKDASTRWEEKYTWTITKDYDETYKGFIGDAAFDHNYEVFVDQTVTPQNFLVSGEISVFNPADSHGNMTVSLTDLLATGYPATVDCGDGATSVTVAPGATEYCSYSGYLDDKTDGTNTATGIFNGVSFVTTEGYTFGDPEIIGYPTINVTDNKYGALGSASDDKTFYVIGSFQCSGNPADYTDGVWVMDEFVNTATIEETGQSDDAKVNLTCYAPVISKDADGSYDEYHDWSVDKSVDPTQQSAFAGDTVDFAWTVTVEEDVWEENFGVTGQINVYNPAPMGMTVKLSDVLDDGTVASIIDCSDSGVTWDGDTDTLFIPEGVTAVCDYEATDTGGPGLNNFAAALPGQVQFRVTYPVAGGEAYFPHVYVTGAPLTGDFDGWCVDTDNVIYQNTSYTANVYSSYEDLPAGLVEKPYNFDLINWILNQGFVGQTSPGGYGTYTYGDVQRAIWTLIEDQNSTSGLGSWNQNRVNEILAGANANGEGFVPDCNDYIAVVLQPVLPDGTTTSAQVIAVAQVTMIEVGLECPAENTATATLNDIDFSATAEIEWTKTIVHESVTLNDDYNPAWPTDLTDGGEWTYTDPDGYTCSTDPEDYVGGGGTTYQATIENLATLYDGDEFLDDGYAETVVDCYIPTIEKTAAGTYDERHEWTVDKTVTPLEQGGYPGDVLGWTWTVYVYEEVFEENFDVAGTITVGNPNPEDDLVVPLSDKLSDDTEATVTGCTGDGVTFADGTLTVPAGGTAVCSYEANDLGYADDAAAPNNNTASIVLNGITFSGDAAIEYTANRIRENATLTDDEIGLNKSLTGHTQAGTYTFGPYTGPDSHTCSSNRADYFVNGVYTQMTDTIVNWAYVYSDDELQDKDDATTTWTCDASFVDLYKTTNGQPADPTMDIAFALYSYVEQPPNADPKLRVPTLEETVSTLNNGANLYFQTALRPGDEYTICEYPVPAAYTFEISVNGDLVLTYAGPPGEENPTGEIQCFDFTAEPASTTSTFDVENRYPGGAPRTPGYWKNWSRCSGGNQADTADRLNDYLGPIDGAGVFLLDDLLPQTIGSFTIETCEDGVSILDSRTLSGDNMSNDAAYTLAKALLAARLNQNAGACVPLFEEPYVYDPKKGDMVTLGTFEEVLTAADGVLEGVEFDGTGDYLGPKNKDQRELAAYALWLYEIIDDYNNSYLCTGEESH
jgi:hypothetical protein